MSLNANEEMLAVLILLLIILMMILMVLNLNIGYADTDADSCIRIMSMCCNPEHHAPLPRSTCTRRGPKLLRICTVDE